MDNVKFDWNDISITPDVLSTISSRSEVNIFKNGKLPLFTAPMDTVIDLNNVSKFEEQNINICLPRHIKYNETKNDNYFYSYGLDEIINIFDNGLELPKKVLIDIANGHMMKLYDFVKKLKDTYGSNIELMVGNIANPKTYQKYCDIGVDYVRVGIGASQVCTTSANVSIHYPMASLIKECYEISKMYNNPSKIIADGGFKSFSDIIKALALGSDYVMIGSLFSKTLESCSDTFIINSDFNFSKISVNKIQEKFEQGTDLYKYYRGMSTKEVQKSWNKSVLKTAEGISKYNKVEYTLKGWVENFSDYLKSAMSYTDCRSLDEFIGGVEYVFITQNAFNRFNK